MNARTQLIGISVLTAATALAGTAMGGDTVVTFEDSNEGWSGPNGTAGGVGTFRDPASGNPAPALHTIFNDFGVSYRNTTNPAFVRDYTAVGSVTISVDVKVNQISFFGSPVPRPWLLELKDFDSAVGNYPWSSVWFKFADISASQHGEWTTFSVTIDDTTAVELPSGWGGTGAEDPVTFEPQLPDSVTFAQVLAGVDEVSFTTLEPGFFFGFTDHDIEIDNITVTLGSAGCNAADIAEPFDVLDLGDVQAFIGAFVSNDAAADIAEPFGVFDLADLQGFVASFLSGCP